MKDSKIIEWMGRSYEMVPEEANQNCKGCIFWEEHINCDAIEDQWIDMGLIETTCAELRVIFKRIDPLYADLQKAKELAD